MEHINREKAYEILKKYMVGENYIEHSLAVEAIMRKIAEKIAPDKETRFAAGANREYMMHIERCGIPYAEFAELSLDAMKDFAY